MQTVGTQEAKTNSSATPVAEMQQHKQQNVGDAKAAIAEIMELRKDFAGAFEGENIKVLIEEGRQ